MNWTHSRPTEPGWWWFKHAKQPGICLWIYQDGGELMNEGHLKIYKLTELEGQWAGPIPEPTEAAQPHYVDKAVGMDLNTKLK